MRVIIIFILAVFLTIILVLPYNSTGIISAQGTPYPTPTNEVPPRPCPPPPYPDSPPPISPISPLSPLSYYVYLPIIGGMK